MGWEATERGGRGRRGADGGPRDSLREERGRAPGQQAGARLGRRKEEPCPVRVRGPVQDTGERNGPPPYLWGPSTVSVSTW